LFREHWKLAVLIQDSGIQSKQNFVIIISLNLTYLTHLTDLTHPWHLQCFATAMMDVALSILALVAGGVTLELFAAARAPLGYQDDRGFHFGSEPRTGEEVQRGNPS
jgi:hypothetical protein